MQQQMMIVMSRIDNTRKREKVKIFEFGSLLKNETDQYPTLTRRLFYGSRF